MSTSCGRFFLGILLQIASCGVFDLVMGLCGSLLFYLQVNWLPCYVQYFGDLANDVNKAQHFFLEYSILN